MEADRLREQAEQRELLDMVNQLDMLTGLNDLDFSMNDLADAAHEAKAIDVESLEEAELAEYRTAFNACDADGSGAITILELENALGMAGCANVDQDNLMMAISSIDDDSDGELNFAEFVRLTRMLKSMTGNPAADPHAGAYMTGNPAADPHAGAPHMDTMEIEHTTNPMLQ